MLTGDLGFRWFLPGFVHPLQAMMLLLLLLLLHLTTCASLLFENGHHTKDLLHDSFQLVGIV